MSLILYVKTYENFVKNCLYEKTLLFQNGSEYLDKN